MGLSERMHRTANIHPSHEASKMEAAEPWDMTIGLCFLLVLLFNGAGGGGWFNCTHSATLGLLIIKSCLSRPTGSDEWALLCQPQPCWIWLLPIPSHPGDFTLPPAHLNLGRMPPLKVANSFLWRCLIGIPRDKSTREEDWWVAHWEGLEI